MPTKKTILIDFDGVLSTYEGWKGEQYLGEPLPHVRAAVAILAKNFKLICFTTRSKHFIEPWLAEHGLAPFFAGVTNIKIPAFAQIDDRSIEFKGEWNDELIVRIREFKPWWEGNKILPKPSTDFDCGGTSAGEDSSDKIHKKEED